MSDIQSLSFTVDGFRLFGNLHLPDVQNPPVVIGCHGLLASRESPKQVRLAALCNDHAIAYLRFDHRGCGQSEGHISDGLSFPARCQDLYHAIRLMETHPQTGPLLGLFGSSFGGAVVLGVSARNPVPAIVTFAAPVHGIPDLARTLPELSQLVSTAPDLSKSLAFDLRPSLGAIANILIVHGDRDAVVPIQHAHELLSRCSSPKKLQIQSGGDHPMSSPEHQAQFGETFIDWISMAARGLPKTL